MLFIDLEGTLINDLEDRQILQENIVKVKSFITKHFESKGVPKWIRPTEHIGIFTFGWLTEKEINRDMISILENVLGFNLDFVIVKENVMYLLRDKDVFHYDKSLPLDVEAEVFFNSQLSKQDAFIQYVKHSCTDINTILIDDQVERMNVEFPKTRTSIQLYNIEDL